MTKTTKPKPENTKRDIKKIVIKKSDVSIHDKKVDQLINLLNDQTNGEQNFTFWKDKNGMGDIVGTVPIVRTIKQTVPGHFNPLDKVYDEKFLKFYVIDLSDVHSEWIPTRKDMDRRDSMEKRGINYIKHNNPNVIFNIVINNL